MAVAAYTNLLPPPLHPKPYSLPLTLNRYDLYTKASSVPDINAVWPHYQEIIDRLCPGELDW